MEIPISLRSASYITGIVIGILITFKLVRSKKKGTRKVPRGTVILHQFERPYLGVPNLSPPCMKLETYLRMTKIPYECDYTLKFSRKGQMPWIEYNGKEIADSNFCIEFLNKEFGVDVDDHLSDEQKGIARAVLVMLEANTFCTVAYFRGFDEGSETIKKIFFGNVIFPLRNLVFRFVFQRAIRRNLHGQGIGRHSPEEIYGIAEKDLRSVSAILGEKKFLFGDKPCLADVFLFALVSNFIFLTPVAPQAKLILTQLKNLEGHANRMKEAYYPDWDEVALGQN
ncbi:failed axon connections homolog [Exaiptasia diaphana]|uniref:Uncharacterized protein n=1 Tax=Exaiptasia diaphana TaxID=2652724 RepID=A0A913XDY6_EXADI|nr:failed axon connections homolog [Exaiptasia diaphana]KXJ12862.1 Failed axon connections-like [Exaiptasia diaphana]